MEDDQQGHPSEDHGEEHYHYAMHMQQDPRQAAYGYAVDPRWMQGEMMHHGYHYGYR